MDFFLIGAPPEPKSSLATIDIEENLVVKLGIVGSTQKHEPTGPSSRESRSGVLVVARLDRTDVEPELVVGDVIRSVNAISINCRCVAREQKGKAIYVAFDLD